MATVIVSGLAAVSASAHHSIAQFDGRQVAQITGVVTAFRWINPHVRIEIDCPGVVGAIKGQWVVEMQAPTAMMSEGWHRDTLALGDHITVFVNPLRAEDPGAARHRGQYVGVVLPDGSKLGGER